MSAFLIFGIYSLRGNLFEFNKVQKLWICRTCNRTLVGCDWNKATGCDYILPKSYHIFLHVFNVRVLVGVN